MPDRSILMTIAQQIVDNSSGRAHLAFEEEDDSDSFVPDAAHFIKVDGKRVGRDIEMYGFFGDGPMGWERALALFLQEVLIPIKSHELKASYDAASATLRNIGHEVYKPEVHAQWDACF